MFQIFHDCFLSNRFFDSSLRLDIELVRCCELRLGLHTDHLSLTGLRALRLQKLDEPPWVGGNCFGEFRACLGELMKGRRFGASVMNSTDVPRSEQNSGTLTARSWAIISGLPKICRRSVSASCSMDLIPASQMHSMVSGGAFQDAHWGVGPRPREP